MNAHKLVSAFVAVLVVTAGLSAAAGNAAAIETTSGDATVTTTYDDGNVTVVAEYSDTAISNATVYESDSTVATTDENGTATFQWNGTQGDELTLRVEATVNDTDVTVDETAVLDGNTLVDPANYTTSLANATIDAAYNDSSSNVTLTVADDGDGLDGVNVTANGDSVGPTGEDGTVTFALEGDTLNVTLERDDDTRSATWVLHDGELVAPSLANATIDAAYDNGSVAVEVADNGVGIENVSVTANNESVGLTDETGTLTFDWSPPEQNETESDEETEADGNETESDEETESYELELVLEKNDVTRNVTLTFEDGELTREQEREGPPTDMPEQVPDHVERIHAIINKFLDGNLDSSLGQAVSDIVRNGGEKGKPADAGAPAGDGPPGNETATGNETAAGNGNGNGPGNGNGEDNPGQGDGDGPGNGHGEDNPGQGNGNGNGPGNGNSNGPGT